MHIHLWEECKVIENTERPRLRPQKELQTRSKTPTKSIFLTGLQLIICAVAIVAVFLIKQFGGDIYTQIKPTVQGALNTNITQGDVTQVFKDLGKQLPDAAEIFKNSPGVSSSLPQGSSAPASSSSQASSSSSAAQAGKASQAPSQPAASSVVVTSTNAKDLAFVKPKINTTLCSTDSQKPPETASTAPFRLSVKPLKPVDGKLTSAYGYRVNPVTGKYTFHTGMDIAAPEGTPIKATLAGVVSEVASDQTYGNYCIIDHGDGVTSFYAECAEINVKKGDKIAAGGLVGTVGTTGITTGPHLHFEIRINSKNHNPQWVM